MTYLSLRDFGQRTIRELVHQHEVTMRYDTAFLKRKGWLGAWSPSEMEVLVLPNHKLEAVIIVHEWLHAYEDLILQVPERYRETQVDWWAYWHLRNSRGLVKYIRSFFPAFVR